MKPARLVVLGIAVVAGGVAAYLASSSRQPPPKAPPPVVETVDILVAKANLARGQIIRTVDIGWQVWPKAAANSSFIKKSSRPEAINQFAGAIVRVPVVAGDPIRDPAVVFAKGSGFMAAILPQGMRAVSVGVTAESSAGGFILPDDHVDILLTHREKDLDKNSTGEKFVTDTILRNVPVLAVDQAVAEKNGEKVVIGKTATLELMPAQAETLAHARQIGTLSLSLRSILDSQSSTPEGAEHKEDAPSINTVRYGVSSLTFSP